MDNDKKRELLESFAVEMGIDKKEREDFRTEYIASSNTLKVNKAAQPDEQMSEVKHEESIEDKLRKVADVYKSDTQRLDRGRR